MIDINELSASVPRDENEYLGQDGLIYCSVCGEPREVIIENELIGKRKVRCVCKCTKDKEAAVEERKRQEECDRQRRICFGDCSELASCTFENSEDTEYIRIAKNYVANFKDFKQQGKGLLLFGSVGTGKSHMAACIANSLIDEGYTVLMSNFATMINKLQESFEGRQKYMDSLNKYSLLVIDDLGAERNSEYMREQVFNIIDSRNLSGLPFIITTNLPPEELKKTGDIGKGRIYDRILGKCHPVEVKGESYRRKKLKEEFKQMEMLLKG